jgi:hypothetical protein
MDASSHISTLSSEKTVDHANITGKLESTDSDIYARSASLDPIYEAKARVLNNAIQEIGMGKYQVCFRSFFICNFGERLSARINSVVSLHSDGLWMAAVSSQIFRSGYLLYSCNEQR